MHTISSTKQAATALLVCLTLALAGSLSPAKSKQCAASAFSREVDAAAAALRSFNSEMSPVLQSRIAQLKTAKGWSDDNYQSLAQDYLFDARTAALDGKANSLLMRLDELGEHGEKGGADCARLDELKATGVELLAVMKAKSSYTLARIDEEISAGRGVSTDSSSRGRTELHLPDGAPAEPFADAAKAPQPDKSKPKVSKTTKSPKQADAPKKQAEAPKPKAVEEKTAVLKPKPATEKPELKKSEPQKSEPKKPESKKLAARKPEPQRHGSSWETVTEAAPPMEQNGPHLPADPQYADASPVIEPPPGSFAGPEEGYTIEEIRDATRGFFGTISTNLATVLEHAFRQWGQPTGYVMGKEGGGAFLAGVRYGKGTLFMRNGLRRQIYWHGPSVGYDFGAEGSRTLFLIYSLHSPEGLFRNFTGVDGSAYLVGGVGVTLLKGGPIILAPIRSGLGLRLGANIGYVRFTPEQTWNPF